MAEIFSVILCIVVIVFLLLFDFGMSYIRFHLRPRRLTRKQKLQTKESLDYFTHKHSEHWEYVKDVVHWRIRLRLSRFRGKERPLTWRIKLLAFFTGMGPQVAEWVLEEYMITAKVEETHTADSWACSKCGTNNPDTALFCKDCGEYK